MVVVVETRDDRLVGGVGARRKFVFVGVSERCSSEDREDATVTQCPFGVIVAAIAAVKLGRSYDIRLALEGRVDSDETVTLRRNLAALNLASGRGGELLVDAETTAYATFGVFFYEWFSRRLLDTLLKRSLDGQLVGIA